MEGLQAPPCLVSHRVLVLQEQKFPGHHKLRFLVLHHQAPQEPGQDFRPVGQMWAVASKGRIRKSKQYGALCPATCSLQSLAEPFHDLNWSLIFPLPRTNANTHGKPRPHIRADRTNPKWGSFPALPRPGMNASLRQGSTPLLLRARSILLDRFTLQSSQLWEWLKRALDKCVNEWA